MANETALAEVCEQAERERQKDLLLSLLREHIKIELEVTHHNPGRTLAIKVDFDGEPIATDFVTI